VTGAPLTRRTALATLATATCAPRSAFASPEPWARAAAIERSMRPPRFAQRQWSIADAGAVAEDVGATTQAFSHAIQACAQAGGGRVLVPPGRWLTGAIRLRSGVELHVAEGATLVFSTDPAHYPLVATRWEGVELINYSPLVFADGERDVAITGRGVLEGQGEAWWSWSSGRQFGWRPGQPDQRKARQALFDMAERGVPVLGVCNGFQILVESGLLPGALIKNESLKFVCRWTGITVESNRTPFTRGMKLKAQNTGKSMSVNAPIMFFASDRELAEEAYAGDVIGIPNHGVLRVGDSLSETGTLRFAGLPNFAPEILRRVRVKDPLKAKHLKRALEGLAEEGVTQLFRPILGSDFVVGAVGQLQFEVMADRLLNEYQLDVIFEPAPYAEARWLHGTAAQIETFASTHRTAMAEDIDASPIFLGKSAWEINYVAERYPDLQFLRTRERG